jgi:hypothetical protein
MTVEFKSHACEGVPDEALKCLLSYPEGTKGREEQWQLLLLINSLCKTHGYGGFPQMCNWVEKLWRNPELQTKLAAMSQRRIEMLLDFNSGE